MLQFGFLFIDKPQGISSFDVVRKLRKIFQVRRIGYAGTLDPLATGLMIVAVGEATKMLHYLEGLDKRYEVTVQFGATSTTYDADGKITQFKNARHPSKILITKTLREHFLGARRQQPPIFSAVHVEGKRAYDLARQGKKVELKKRPVHFYELKILSYHRSDTGPLIRLRLHCSSGTYVRSLAHDLGQMLECGGYVRELRRTHIGKFSISKAVKLEKFTALSDPSEKQPQKQVLENFLIKPEKFFPDWPQLELTHQEYEILAQGGFLPFSHSDFLDIQVSAHYPILAIYKQQCVGLLELVDSSGRPLNTLPQAEKSAAHFSFISSQNSKVRLKFLKKFNHFSL